MPTTSLRQAYRELSQPGRNCTVPTRLAKLTGSCSMFFAAFSREPVEESVSNLLQLLREARGNRASLSVLTCPHRRRPRPGRKRCPEECSILRYLGESYPASPEVIQVSGLINERTFPAWGCWRQARSKLDMLLGLSATVPLTTVIAG